jgi:hypothetical protein
MAKDNDLSYFVIKRFDKKYSSSGFFFFAESKKVRD